jgi:hypothetical protein
MTLLEVVSAARRILGIESSMNVWKKTFTREPSFLENEWLKDMAFLAGERWPIGTTVNIKTPTRYQRGPAGVSDRQSY